MLKYKIHHDFITGILTSILGVYADIEEGFNLNEMRSV